MRKLTHAPVNQKEYAPSSDHVSLVSSAAGAKPTPEGNEVFQLWLEAESKKSVDPLKPHSALPYASIWNSWLKYLASNLVMVSKGPEVRSLTWQEARPEHVSQFLRPRAGQKAAHNPGRQLSEVTRRRYWRVLDRVYLFASTRGWIVENPAEELSVAETPPVSPQLGHVLPAEVWAALPSCFPNGDSMNELRDRAILSLLYELALAPEEIRHMRPADIGFDESSPNQSPRPFTLRIEGKRQHQSRVLLIPDASGRALQHWIKWREESDRASRSEWMFVSNRGTPLAISVLFSAVSACVLRAGKMVSQETAQALPKRVGPQVLRNTAITQLLRSGRTPAEVVNFIGIKNEKGLQRLLQSMTAPSAPGKGQTA